MKEIFVLGACVSFVGSFIDRKFHFFLNCRGVVSHVTHWQWEAL
jgi:hypothetical protein